MLRKKSKKVGETDLKKVAKTAGHVKMTEENLINWQSIEEEMVSNQRSSNYDKLSRRDSSVNNIYGLQSAKNTRNHTENAF